MQDRLPFQRVMETSRSEGGVDGWGTIYWRVVAQNWFRDMNLLMMNVEVSEILTQRWGWWRRSVYRLYWRGISGSRCRQHKPWRWNKRRGSNRILWREIRNRLIERNIDRHKILPGRGIITPISFLSSRNPTKTHLTDDNLSNSGDKSWTKQVQQKTGVIEKTLLLG